MNQFSIQSPSGNAASWLHRALGVFFMPAVLFLMGGLAAAQSHDHDCGVLFHVGSNEYVVQYGEPVQVTLLNESGATASWTVSPAPNEGKSSGSGNATDRMVFKKPGTYRVVFSGTDGHRAEATVTVSDTKMRFLTDRAEFSQQIRQGTNTEGITLTIPVEISSYHKQPLTFGPMKNTSTGIAGITVDLPEEVKLRQGMNRITFRLSGVPAGAGKAQLGFFNHLGEGFFHNFLIAE